MNPVNAGQIILTAAQAVLTVMVELTKASNIISAAQAQGRDLNEQETATILQFEKDADAFFHKQLEAKKLRDAGEVQ